LRQKKSFKKVELDLKLLLDTHNKLVNGKTVEPKVVNTLLLGGILNILCQSEQFDEAMDRLKALEVENVQNKFRLESLENWLIKMNDKTQEAFGKIQKLERTGPKDSTQLKNQIGNISKELCSLKETILTPEASTCIPKRKSCSECDETFEKTFEMEKHMVNVHGSDKPHACEVCDKTFYLKWRLDKHMNIHEGSHKMCKYLQDGKVCPFSEVGCKFMHEVTEADSDEDNEAKKNKDDEPEEYLCTYCNAIFPSQEHIIQHMGSYHMDCFPHIQQENSLITF